MMPEERRFGRRRMLQSTGAACASLLLAGCGGTGGNGGDKGGDGGDSNGGGGGATKTVAVAPDGQYIFKPDKVTIKTGDTVKWEFKNRGHNVCAWPKMHEKISIPDGAKGFGSMDKGGNKFSTVPKGETFEHTFETKGKFHYVCVPHAGMGMVGDVVVE